MNNKSGSGRKGGRRWKQSRSQSQQLLMLVYMQAGSYIQATGSTG